MSHRLRRARPGEADVLTALCVRSKAHWGYDAEFMQRCREGLRVRPAAIRGGRVMVLVDGQDRPLGVAQVDVEADTADLALLFVDPPAIGRGVGRALFREAMARAAASGARRLTVLADPNAAGFYEAMGARYLRLAPSDAIPGRDLPLYEIALSAGVRAA